MTKTQDIYETTTQAMIEAIEAGADKWEMPWNRDGAFPLNAETRKQYRGGNFVMFAVVAMQEEYPTNEWATYKQWTNLGAQVRKGEHGTHYLAYQPAPKPKNETDETNKGHRGFFRSHVAFNASQVDGYTPQTVELNTDEHIERAEAFFTAIGANVRESNQGRAYYRPSDDSITLPPFSTFVDAPAYYATSAHEHAHWTGHATRLNRDLSGRFGNDQYAVEELVAELSSAFTCAVLGITSTPRPDHAQYLAHWIKVLKADAQALHHASSKAQSASDYLIKASGMADALAHKPLADDNAS